MTTVFSGLCLVALLQLVAAAKSVPKVLLAIAFMATLLLMQLFFLTERSRRLGQRGRIGCVALQAAVGLLPFLVFGQAWVGMPGFVAGGALLMLPAPYSVVTFAVVVGVTGAVQALLNATVLLVVYTTVSTVLTGLIVYGLSRMSVLVEELHRTRTEMARLAVFQERLRFARDLHDLLGYSLSAISLKSELTRRLVGKNPERSLVELEEIRDIARQALADVRVLASGYRDMSLEDEVRSARSVLAAADIKVELDMTERSIEQHVGTALATVLREGVTNLLQHSKAEHCRITVACCGDRVHMTIGNDGAIMQPRSPDPHRGSGLRNLSARVGALGGTLSSDLGGDGWFELHAELPSTVAESPEGADVIPLQRPATTNLRHARSG
ncbi:sensor histidine kinase [Micromonospora sp. DT228]|uniref:sensor histidine kinase n=1 Tax=Micromonospora sp. DT228 TaxID=3393443 RepID=UPI003CF9A50B